MCASVCLCVYASVCVLVCVVCICVPACVCIVCVCVYVRIYARVLASVSSLLHSKQRHNKLWRPESDCDLPDGQQASAPICGPDGPGDVTPEPGALCCDEAWGGQGSGASPCRTIGVEVDPADPPNYNYYFRRLSDSALDSDPSTPVRAPPLLDMERVFIQIEDVERDALLDDEGFERDCPLPHFGPPSEGTAAQTCCRPEPLEELRMRLEFSTVEEEDEEEAQKEEAEMEALARSPGGAAVGAAGGAGLGGGGGGGGGEEGGGDEGMAEEEEEEEREEEESGPDPSCSPDMAALNRLGNENSNNNNSLGGKRSFEVLHVSLSLIYPFDAFLLVEKPMLLL